MQTTASLGFLASQGAEAFMPPNTELKPRAMAIFPLFAVGFAGACEAGGGAADAALVFAEAGSDDFSGVLLCIGALLGDCATLLTRAVGFVGAAAVLLAIRENNRDKDVEDVVDEGFDSSVAAPGPSPKAGTDPTCFDADPEAPAVCSSCDGCFEEIVGTWELGFGVVKGLLDSAVAAPGPSPKAGTEPTCFETAAVADASCR